MPRPKTLGDAEVLAAAHRLVHERGPSALTLQRWRGLAACRHPRWCNGSRASRSSCAAPCPMLGTVWTSGPRSSRLPCRRRPMARSHSGGAFRDYGIESYADGLLIPREDLRDPVLRSRGAAWKASLSRAIEDCFSDMSHAPPGIGLLLAAQWQGSLLWWSSTRRAMSSAMSRMGLRHFVSTVIPARRAET